MGRPLKIKESATVDVGFANPPGNSQFYGVVGGEDTLSTYGFPTLKVRVRIAGQSEADGWIIRQKGATKYLVEDASANQGVCTLANSADAALAEGTMTITAQDSGSTEFRIKRMSNKFCLDFSDNRYLTNFFDVAASVTKSGGETTTTIELVQVDNPNLYG